MHSFPVESKLISVSKPLSNSAPDNRYWALPKSIFQRREPQKLNDELYVYILQVHDSKFLQWSTLISSLHTEWNVHVLLSNIVFWNHFLLKNARELVRSVICLSPLLISFSACVIKDWFATWHSKRETRGFISFGTCTNWFHYFLSN